MAGDEYHDSDKVKETLERIHRALYGEPDNILTTGILKDVLKAQLAIKAINEQIPVLKEIYREKMAELEQELDQKMATIRKEVHDEFAVMQKENQETAKRFARWGGLAAGAFGILQIVIIVITILKSIK